MSHASQESVRISSGEKEEDGGQHNKTMEEYSKADSQEIQSQFAEQNIQVVHFNNLRNHKEEYADRRYAYDPGGNFHADLTDLSDE